MNNTTNHRTSRRGFSLLELQVSFVAFGIALAGLAPLAVLQTKQLRKLDERLKPARTYYLVPPADTWARRLGAAATRTTTPPTTASYPSQAYINFQQPADPAPGSFGGHSYRADVGSVFGDRGGGYYYGWSADNTANARNRNLVLSPDERYDTLNHMQKFGLVTWEIALPNGIYNVRLVSGDPGFLDSVFSINLEGFPFLLGVPILGQPWVEANGVVVVRDGRLTVSNGALAANNKLCFIKIEPASPLKDLQILSLQKALNSEEVSATLSVLAP